MAEPNTSRVRATTRATTLHLSRVVTLASLVGLLACSDDITQSPPSDPADVEDDARVDDAAADGEALDVSSPDDDSSVSDAVDAIETSDTFDAQDISDTEDAVDTSDTAETADTVGNPDADSGDDGGDVFDSADSSETFDLDAGDDVADVADAIDAGDDITDADPSDADPSDADDAGPDAPPLPTILFVDSTRAESGDGRSWEGAIRSLDEALDSSSVGPLQVHLREGFHDMLRASLDRPVELVGGYTAAASGTDTSDVHRTGNTRITTGLFVQFTADITLRNLRFVSTVPTFGGERLEWYDVQFVSPGVEFNTETMFIEDSTIGGGEVVVRSVSTELRSTMVHAPSLRVTGGTLVVDREAPASPSLLRTNVVIEEGGSLLADTLTLSPALPGDTTYGRLGQIEIRPPIATIDIGALFTDPTTPSSSILIDGRESLPRWTQGEPFACGGECVSTFDVGVAGGEASSSSMVGTIVELGRPVHLFDFAPATRLGAGCSLRQFVLSAPSMDGPWTVRELRGINLTLEPGPLYALAWDQGGCNNLRSDIGASGETLGAVGVVRGMIILNTPPGDVGIGAGLSPLLVAADRAMQMSINVFVPTAE